MMHDDEAIGRLIGLAAADHPALRYASIFGMLMVVPDEDGALKRALESLEWDPHPKIKMAAAVVRGRLQLDAEPEPTTGVETPMAKGRSNPPQDVAGDRGGQ